MTPPIRLHDPDAPRPPGLPALDLEDPAFVAYSDEKDREMQRRLAEEDAAVAEVALIEEFLAKMTGRTA